MSPSLLLFSDVDVDATGGECILLDEDEDDDDDDNAFDAS
jgi:hypothetical protein